MARGLALELDDEVAERVEQLAAREGRTLEEQVRQILAGAANTDGLTRDQVLADLPAIQAMTPPGPRMLAEDLIREGRDSR